MGKLIIIRGPSGSGKTTVAKALFEQAADGTVLIGQDYYRFIFKPAGGKINAKSIHKMVKSDILTCLKDGYDVIAEGIFIKKSWQRVFESIFKHHKTDNYIFTYDINFAETIRRHRTKSNRKNWSETAMKDWYAHQDFLGYNFEYKIPEKFSAKQALEFIQAKTGVKRSRKGNT